MRLSAKPFLWKWVLFAWEWKIIFISLTSYLAPHFETKAWDTAPKSLFAFGIYPGVLNCYFVLTKHNMPPPTVFTGIVPLQGSERTRRKDKEALKQYRNKIGVHVTTWLACKVTLTLQTSCRDSKDTRAPSIPNKTTEKRLSIQPTRRSWVR